ncbi:MAG: 4Fe-4S dicluster domain-containing protein [Firmicutes bacterium]|nr:4Fe-4S dicluster domain-containing protein [Bacillota bacterium]
MEMVEENARIAAASDAGCFTEGERELVGRVRDIIHTREKVPCTECRYCMPCPAGVDIPANFHYYNLMHMDTKRTGRREFFQVMGLSKAPGYASLCLSCGKCESHCPQHIKIIDELKEADRALRPSYYRIGTEVARFFVNMRRLRRSKSLRD